MRLYEFLLSAAVEHRVLQGGCWEGRGTGIVNGEKEIPLHEQIAAYGMVRVQGEMILSKGVSRKLLLSKNEKFRAFSSALWLLIFPAIHQSYDELICRR